MNNNAQNDLKHLMCPICRETYSKQARDPVNIRCGHDLCRKCLKDMYDKKGVTFPCPLCRREHDGTPPSRMATNYTLLDNADRSRASSIISCENESNQLNEDSTSLYAGNYSVSMPVNIPVGHGSLTNFFQTNSMSSSPFPVLALSSSPRGLYRTPSNCQCFQESSYSSSQASLINLQGKSVDLFCIPDNESTIIPSALPMGIANLSIYNEHGNSQEMPTSYTGTRAKDGFSQHETIETATQASIRNVQGDYRPTHATSAPPMNIEHDNDQETLTSFTEDSTIGDMNQHESNTAPSKSHDKKVSKKKKKSNIFIDTLCKLFHLID